jgi:hypothetical protein
MSASRTKKERQANATLSVKQQQELAQQKKSRRNTIIYTILGIVAAILVIALLVWDNGVIQKHVTALRVGDESYGVADLDYYYYSTYNSYYSYASLYGLDTSVALDEQEVYDGYTWDQMLKDSAVSTLTNVSVLAQEAEAAGYTLSEDGQSDVDAAVSNISTYAALYSVTTDYYLQSVYGKYMTMKDYERIVTEYELAQEYAQFKSDSLDVSDDEIDDYYDENSVSFDTIDYSCYLVSFDRTETDDDGNTTDLDADTIEANRAQAEAEAQEILDALTSGDTDAAASLAEDFGATDYTNVSGISYTGYADWMSDSSHQAGSSDVVAYTSTDDDGNETVIGYYAILVNDRYLDEYYGADIRVIRTSATADEDGNYDMDTLESEMNDILAEYESGDKTEVSFGDLADTYSADASTYTAGLRENVSKSIYNDEINEWLFDSSRKTGDYATFTNETNHNCYLIYYVGHEDTLYWRTTAESSVRSTKYSTWLEEATANYSVKESGGMKFVG